MDTERMAGVFAGFSAPYDWIPGWAIGLGLIALAVAAALIVHGAAVRLVRRARFVQHPVLKPLLLRTIGPTRMALVVFACAMALRVAPFQAGTAALLSQLLVVASSASSAGS
jgi:hypothetical protein